MYGIVNRIEIQLFCTFGDIQFVLASSGFCHHTFLKVGLGVPNNLTEQLGEQRCMICFFVSIFTESCSNLRITFTVSLTSHSQVLTYLGAFSHKVSTQTIVDNRILYIFSYAYHMLAGEVQLIVRSYFPLYDLFALRATLRCLSPFVYITTDRANEFLCHSDKYLLVNFDCKDNAFF